MNTLTANLADRLRRVRVEALENEGIEDSSQFSEDSEHKADFYSAANQQMEVRELIGRLNSLINDFELY